ncbi:MAG: TIGR02466 family protein [Pseudomonadota bacterium]
MGNTFSMLFGTPFASYDWPDSDGFNAELGELILSNEKDDTSGRGIRSNAGGWQSGGNMMTWEHPTIATLKQRFESLVFNVVGELVQKDGRNRQFRLLMDGWANVCRRGDYNVVHSHPNAMFSLVYYVAAGESDSDVPYSGLLELLDPRESANYIQIQNTILDARTFIDNQPGKMVLFPSWVKHMVHPFQGDGTRISIACNVNVVETNPLKP